MNGGTHIAFGLLAGGVLASAAVNKDVAFGMNAVTVQCVIATVVGSLAPDIDNRQAPIARVLPFLTKPISRRWPHRTGLHSLAGLMVGSGLVLGILWLLAFAGLWLGPRDSVLLVAQFFACGWLSHLLLDTATKQGIRWFWPLLKNPLGYPSLEEDRIISGDKRWEFIISGVSLVLFGAMIPVIEQGADTTLANVIGQFKQLKGVYVNAVNQEVVLSFEGYRKQDKAPVSGRGIILAAVDDYFAVFWNEQVRFVGQESGDIHLLSGRCQTLDVAPSVRETVYRNTELADIVADIRGPALASGELKTDRIFRTNGMVNTRTIGVTATALELRFASRTDIEVLRVKAKEMGLSSVKLQKAIEHGREVVDSLVAVRQKLTDLYARDRLYADIKAQRKKVSSLADKLKEKTEQEKPLHFSGRLSFRMVPTF